MNIVVLGIRGFPGIQGGIENHCQHLYPRLVKNGCNVTIFARSNYVGVNEYTFEGIRIVPVPTVRKKSLETVIHTGTCCSLLRKYSPDIVHFHAIGPSLFVPFVKLSKAKIVATHHGFDYDRKKWGIIAKRVLRYGERQMCKADAVISISKHIGEFLKKRYNCNSFHIPNGVVLPEIIKPGSYCKRWSLQKGRYILFAGRMVPEKGVHELIEAFTSIKTDWKLVIAGDADHKDTYSKKVKKMGKSIKNVVMTGFVSGEELHEIYSNAGCFVLPSSHEGLPIALLEALSYGLPCIASDIPANRSVGHSSITFFPVHDNNQLAKAMYNETNSPRRIDQNEIRDFIQENYNWDTIAQKTIHIYTSLIMKS